MKVQEILHFKGMTQTQVAQALGLSKSNVSSMFRGIKPLPLELVPPLAEMIGASVEDVVAAFLKVRQTHERK